jgi:hypothetical protein
VHLAGRTAVGAEPQVEERSGVVLARRRHGGDAGEPQQQRRGQRALVPRRQHDGDVEPSGPDPFEKRGGGVGVDRRWLVSAPRGGEGDHVVDAGQQPRGLRACGRGEHRHVGVRGDGADGGSGEQDVAVAVGPDDEGPRHAGTSSA